MKRYGGKRANVSFSLTDDSGSNRLDAQSLDAVSRSQSLDLSSLDLLDLSLWLHLIRAFSLSRLAVIFSV